MKRFGNQKPPQILALEHAVWTAIFGISTGKHSALAAFFKLHDEWMNVNWEAKLPNNVRCFFARGRCSYWFLLQEDVLMHLLFFRRLYSIRPCNIALSLASLQTISPRLAMFIR